MQTFCGLLLTVLFVSTLAQDERPPPASVLIKECIGKHLSPCPDYKGALACLQGKKQDMVNYPEDVEEIQEQINELSGKKEIDVCPSLTKEKTCYQALYSKAIAVAEKELRIEERFMACSSISAALKDLKTLKAICKVDMKMMNATAKIIEYEDLQLHNC